MKKENDSLLKKSIDENSGFLLWQVTNMWTLQLRKTLELNHHITHSQYVIMASIYWLGEQNEEVTQILLSQFTKMEPMTVSQILKVLQKKNYINRKEHSTDTRAKSVFLTPQGLDIVEKAVYTVASVDAKFFRVLGKSINKFNHELLALIKQ